MPIFSIFNNLIRGNSSKFALESGSLAVAELYGSMSDGRVTILNSQADELEIMFALCLAASFLSFGDEQRLGVSVPASREER